MKINYKLQQSVQGAWQLYSFTTENIAGYINNFDFKNKKILTVAGSGDHILNSILLGGTTVDAFDINRNALFFSELKLIMVEVLSFEQFLDFFMIDSQKAFDYETYCKISSKLSNYAKLYFDNLYFQFANNGQKLRQSNIFNNKYDTRENKLKYNIYLNKNKYNQLKKSLNFASITLIEGNIKDLCLYQSYDIILLSNISDYLYDFGDVFRLQNYFKRINEFKTDKNIVVFGYVYDMDSTQKRSDIDVPDLRKQIFDNGKYIYNELIFESAIQNKKDCILVLKGEK